MAAESVLAFERSTAEERILVVANLAEAPVEGVEVAIDGGAEALRLDAQGVSVFAISRVE